MAKPRMLYILSPSYSGSTLLTFLLAQHRDIATIGELKATAMGDISQYICSCGAPIQTCDFWAQARAAVKEQGEELALDNFGTHFTADNALHQKVLGAQMRSPVFEVMRDMAINLLPGLARTFQEILNKNRLLVDVTMGLQGGSVFIDGSKDPNRLKYLLQSSYWDIEVISMVRDGRAQANSAREKPLENMDYEKACEEWVYTIQQMELVSRYVSPDKVFSLKYEDLCKDPNKIINDIWAFLGLEAIEQDWGNVALAGGSHHILGNDNMRKSDTVSIRYDERWRDKVSQEELAIYERIAGRTHTALGYS